MFIHPRSFTGKIMAPPNQEQGRKKENAEPAALHFIHAIIEEDNKTDKFGGRVYTRFPP
jgi:hypothetical protein